MCIPMTDEDNILDEIMDESSISVPDPVAREDVSDDLWTDLVKLTNPHLDDKVFAKKALKQEKPKHKEAFLYWNALDDKFRTDRAVAEQYSVSAAVVGKWRRSFNWEGRRNYMRQEDLKRLEDAASRTLEDELKGMLSTSGLVVKKFQEQLLSKKDVSIPDFIKIGEFLIKLHAALHGPKEEAVEDGTSLGKLETLLKEAGGDVKGLMTEILRATVGGDEKLPHDVGMAAEKGQELQESIIVNEIGGDDVVDLENDEDWANIAAS